MASTPRAQVGVDLPDPEPIPEPEVQAEEPSRPEWLPENFNDPADLAKSYAESQRELTQTKQQIAELQRQQEEMQGFLEAQQQPQYDPSDLRSQWEDAFAQDPFGTMAAYQQAQMQQFLEGLAQAQQPQQQAAMLGQAEIVAHAAEQEMAERYADFAEVKDTVIERLVEADLLSDGKANSLPAIVEALDNAYKLVKFDNIQAEPAQPDARSLKMGAQSLTGASVSRSEVDESEEKFNRLLAAHRRSSYGAAMSGQ